MSGERFDNASDVKVESERVTVLASLAKERDEVSDERRAWCEGEKTSRHQL